MVKNIVYTRISMICVVNFSVIGGSVGAPAKSGALCRIER